MEEIIIKIGEIERLVMLLLIQREKLEERANWLILRYKFHRNIERLNCQDLYSIEIINQ